MKKHRKVIVVGAGLAGSVLARKLAEEKDCQVTVIERRVHIAGNVYDEWIDGNLVQKYGPHFMIANQWWIMEYLMRFSGFYEYPVRAVSCLDGTYVDRPYNFRTLQQLLGPGRSESLLRKLREQFQGRRRVYISELMESPDQEVHDYAQLLYDQIYAPYIAKQWGMKAEEISPEVVNRADIVLGYDTQLSEDDFQYLPKEGYTRMVENMLAHRNISVVLNEDALDSITFDDRRKRVLYAGGDIDLLIFTGQTDSLFHYEYGRLPYRSRYFTYEKHDTVQLPCGVVTYPHNFDYIRKTEFSQFNPLKGSASIVQTEYPLPLDIHAGKGNEPYYPVPNEENERLSARYEQCAAQYSNLVLCGRLADYRYYDMDQVIIRAFEVFNQITAGGKI